MSRNPPDMWGGEGDSYKMKLTAKTGQRGSNTKVRVHLVKSYCANEINKHHSLFQPDFPAVGANELQWEARLGLALCDLDLKTP